MQQQQQQQQQPQQQTQHRMRRKRLFPKLVEEHAVNAGFDGPSHYDHWLMFRQRRSLEIGKHELVLNHMKRGLRQRLDRREAAAAAIQEANSESCSSDRYDLQLQQQQQQQQQQKQQLVETRIEIESDMDGHAFMEVQNLQSHRTSQLYTRYSEFGVQRTASTLSTAGALAIDFNQSASATSSSAAAAAAPNLQAMQLAMARDPTFVTSLTQAAVSPPSTPDPRAAPRVANNDVALPPIGAPLLGDTLQLYVISAAAADADAERAAMAELLVPAMRDCARAYGLEFCLVDVKFGGGMPTDDLHWDAEIARLGLVSARRQAQFNTVVLLGEKFGEAEAPSSIPAAEFTLISSEYDAIYERISELRHQRQRELEEVERERRRQEERMQQVRVPARPAADDMEEFAWDDDEDDDGAAKVRKKQQEAERVRRDSQQAKKASLPSVARTVGRTIAMRKTQAEDDIRELEAFVTDGDLLSGWYCLDTNSQPAEYRLRPISSRIPEFRTLRQQPQEQWLRARRQLVASLAFCARRLVRAGRLREDESVVLAAARSSWLDAQVRLGVLQQGPSKAMLFLRNFENLRDCLQQSLARNFTDLLPARNEVDVDKAHCFAALRNDLEIVVPEDKMQRSQLAWSPEKGVNPQRLRTHDNYVRKLCNFVQRELEPQIRRFGLAAMDRDHAADATAELTEQHEALCVARSQDLISRKPEQLAIKRYIKSSSQLPLTIHGAAGSGKSTLAAKCFTKLADWLPEEAVTVARVIGQTSRSSNIRYLLAGICQEIRCKRGGADDEQLPEMRTTAAEQNELEFPGLANEFTRLLQQTTQQQPLALVLDSICQLSSDYEAAKCQWLPLPLPKNVKVILTVTSGQALQQLQKRLASSSSEEHFLELSPMLEEAPQLLDDWLQRAGRRMTQQQRDWALRAFKELPVPLTLRLCCHEALQWSSWQEQLPEVNTRSLKSAIVGYFARLESQFGEAVVRRSLAYITAAKNGLLQQELLDLLSLDDSVIETVSHQFQLPVRRCPPILWLRLRRALGDLLVELFLDRTRTLNWAHAALKEAAADRYLTQKERPVIHKALAEYFDGQWAGGAKKPHLGNEVGSARYVSSQPFYFERLEAPGFACNERKLSELPWHLKESQQQEALKRKCLCNYEFLLAKLLASSVRHLLDMFQTALLADPSDKDIRVVYNSLYLSRTQLERDPMQLATQLLGRITDLVKADKPRAPADPKKFPFVHELYFGARRNRAPTLVPSRSCMAPPTEIDMELMQAHKLPVTALCVNEEGTVAVTSSEDNTIKVWDLTNCRVTRSITSVGSAVIALTLARNESVLVTSELTQVRVFAMKQGTELFSIPVSDDPCAVTVSGDSNSLICFHQGICVMRTWNLEKMSKICDKQLPEKGLHQDRSIVAATRCNGDLVLYGLRGANFARVLHCRSGAEGVKLNCADKASVVTAVQTSREYHIVACQATDLHTRQHLFFLEVFDAKNGKPVRRIKGCVGDNVVDQLLLTSIQQHVVSLNPMRERRMTDMVSWNLETEEHKHFSRHPGISDIGAVYDFRRVVTGSSAGCSLCRWNVQRSMQAAPTKSDTVVGVADIRVSSANSRYALVKLADNSAINAYNLTGGKFSGKIVKSAKSIAQPNDMVLMDGHCVIVLASPGFSPKVPNAKFVYQTLKIFDIKKQKFTVNLNNRVLIIPCAYEEYHVINGSELLCVNEVRTGFVVYSLESGEIIRKIRPDFGSDVIRKKPAAAALIEGGLLQRENDLFDEFVTSRKGTIFMTPWARRNESTSAKNRRYRQEWEDQKQRDEEFETEKANGVADFMLSADQSTLVASFFAHHLCVFDVAAGSQLQLLQHSTAMLHLFTASLSSDGRYLTHPIFDETREAGQLCVWSCRSGKVKRLFSEAGIGAVAINNDCSVLLYGTEAGQLKLRDCRRPRDSGMIRQLSGSVRFQQSGSNSIRLFRDDSWAVVYAGSVSLWKLQQLEMVSVLTPDQPVHSICLGLSQQLVLFALRDSNDPIVMKLMSSGSRRPQRLGARDFGEEESTDSSENEDAEDGEGQ